MDRGSVEIIESWDSRPLSDGLEGLHSLQASEFTGAASAAGSWLFMLNGNVIGVFDGDIDSFRGASGTVYNAPDPAIILLFAMREYGGDTQAQYFTDDTPIREVHNTLTDSGFTGYLKLSENVISGDYFILYYGGRSMNVAIVGNAQRVVTGDEAFELATEEVGIYEVVSVDVSVIDIPSSVESGTEEGTEDSSSSSLNETPEPASPAEDTPDSSTEAVESDEDVPNETAEESQIDRSPEPESESDAVVSEESVSAADTATSDPESHPENEDHGNNEDLREEVSEPSGSNRSSVEPSSDQKPESPSSPSSDDNNDRFSEEEQWRKTRTIPALDPDDSSIQSEQPEPQSTNQPTREPNTQPAANEPAQSPQLSEVEDRIQRQQQKIESLAEKVEDLEEQRNRLETERNQLQSELQQRDSSSQGSDRSSHTISFAPEDALEQTDLFIRYNSKGDATLEDVRYGEIDQSALASNLNLETHTRFSIDEAVVNDQPFREFLHSRIEYQFVKWVTSELPFEIRNTGNEAPLKELYHLLPRIDRVELNGELDATNADEEEITRSFDVIIRDRMGEPLIVANINHERDPADAAMMEKLTDDAVDVVMSHEKLGGAFLVTASFFTPEALEAAADATGGGFLSRDKRKNYVKQSRKNGFHLCLIEARENAFHITSPEL